MMTGVTPMTQETSISSNHVKYPSLETRNYAWKGDKAHQNTISTRLTTHMAMPMAVSTIPQDWLFQSVQTSPHDEGPEDAQKWMLLVCLGAGVVIASKSR